MQCFCLVCAIKALSSRKATLELSTQIDVCVVQAETEPRHNPASCTSSCLYKSHNRNSHIPSPSAASIQFLETFSQNVPCFQSKTKSCLTGNASRGKEAAVTYEVNNEKVLPATFRFFSANSSWKDRQLNDMLWLYTF